LRILLGLIAVALVGAAVFAWVTEPAMLSPAIRSALAAPGDASAGRIVFEAAGCQSCHKSAGQDDPLKLGGGPPLKTAFGQFYPPNISPDVKDGIGGWSVDDFASTLLLGVSPQGEHEYPALPYASYRHLALKDVRDLYAFMRTLPAVAGRAPPNQLIFPLGWRRLLGGWKFLFLGPPDGPDSVTPADDAAFGRYLVEAPGHCGECHTPRNFLGGLEQSHKLSGAPLPDGKGKVPAITAQALKSWSQDDIVTALTLGFTPTGDSLGGPMAEVVRNLSALPPAYPKAIAQALKAGT